MIITIDGPVASGKSSVAKQLAEELHVYYLYTGLLYRAVAYVVMIELEKERGEVVSNDLLKQLLPLISPLKLAFIKDFSYDYGSDNAEKRPYLFYKGEEITPLLYQAKFDQPASIVSADRRVREALLPVQREIAERYNLVADGRDCGSVVFPNADFKFYLTARSEVRAQRVILDEKREVGEISLEKVKAELEERDRRDFERDVAPLSIPEGATIIDNSELTFRETLDRFLQVIRHETF